MTKGRLIELLQQAECPNDGDVICRLNTDDCDHSVLEILEIMEEMDHSNDERYLSITLTDPFSD